MKYFTSAGFAKLQEREGRESALLDWERALEDYAAYLQALLPELPSDLAEFVRAGSLHDASVLAMWTERDSVLRMILQKERDSAHIIDLNYRLVEPECIDTAALPESCRTTGRNWLYDELAAEPEVVFDPNTGRLLRKSARQSRKSRGKKGPLPVFRHSILLSDGSQLDLRFCRFTMRRYPAVQTGKARNGRAVPQSA